VNSHINLLYIKKGVANLLDNKHCFCFRGSYARGDNSKYSDFDFLLLQQKTNLREVSQIIKFLRKELNNNMSLIHYSIIEFDQNIDLLQLLSLNNMKFILGNNTLFVKFQMSLKRYIRKISFTDLFAFLEKDLFSQKDNGQFYNLKNGTFGTVKFEFCELVNLKRPNTYRINTYWNFHRKIRKIINHQVDYSVENSKIFERLFVARNFPFWVEILCLKFFRLTFMLYFNVKKNKLKKTNYGVFK